MFLANYHVLITAGPTCEPIDPVRFISNRSSGRLGYALAAAARRAGAKVTLISGPTALKPPHGVNFVPITTAREMYRYSLHHSRSANLIICAAAVADWRPKQIRCRKLKKSPLTLALSHQGRGERLLELIPNPDILATLCRKRRRGQFIVGFALESENLLANATKKLRQKNCDCIVANRVSSIGAKRHQATLIFKEGKRIKLPPLPKKTLARRLLAVLLPRFDGARVRGRRQRG